jgi:hypothetical protein
MVERNQAQVTCLTRSRRPTVGEVLPGFSCSATPGFGDVLSVEDILEEPDLPRGSLTARVVLWLVRLLALRSSRPRNVNEKR